MFWVLGAEWCVWGAGCGVVCAGCWVWSSMCGVLGAGMVCVGCWVRSGVCWVLGVGWGVGVQGGGWCVCGVLGAELCGLGAGWGPCFKYIISLGRAGLARMHFFVGKCAHSSRPLNPSHACQVDEMEFTGAYTYLSHVEFYEAVSDGGLQSVVQGGPGFCSARMLLQCPCTKPWETSCACLLT